MKCGKQVTMLDVKLVRFAMIMEKAPLHAFNSDVGIKSKGDDLLAIDVSIRFISVGVTGRKVDSKCCWCGKSQNNGIYAISYLSCKSQRHHVKLDTFLLYFTSDHPR